MNELPRTFCITLKETPSRREIAEKTFASQEIPVEFFEGIHGESFGVKTTIPNLEEVPGLEYYITPGHIGCILSHYMLWKTLESLPENEFLIFEDDVQLADGFREKFIEYCQELPEDWQFVYVGYVPLQNESPVKLTEHVAVYKPYGTHAYMVKKSALPTLLETNKILWYHIDMQIRSRSLPLLKHYTLNPSLASQRSVFNMEDPLWYSLCYDWDVDPHKLKKEQSSDVLLFGRGWHPLEKNSEGYFIWTDGRSEFVLNGDWILMEFDVLVEGGSEGNGRIIRPGKPPNDIIFKHGTNHITIDLKNDKSIIIETKSFVPAKVFKSVDTRTLGVRVLRGVTLTAPDKTKHYVPLSNMERSLAVLGKVRVDNYENFRYSPIISHPHGKFNIRNQLCMGHHRSGWGYVLKKLSDVHRDDGTKFDGFLDATFGTSREQNHQIRVIPYRENWVGVFHNPPMLPSFFSDNASPSSIILSKPFSESLPMCKGIYVLSEYHAKFIRNFLGNVPVEVLYHPTEFPDRKFDFDAFNKNPNRKVINIGWWSRRITSIFKLQVNPDLYQKLRLMLSPTNQSNVTIDRIFDLERTCFSPISESDLQSVISVSRLHDDDYDDLLSKNIVFVDLYDASANNVVIECMARTTPILINPLPAVVEYLGSDYPFYFNNLEEASAKLHNLELIKQTHEYLCSWSGREKITSEYFMNVLRKGRIFRSL